MSQWVALGGPALPLSPPAPWRFIAGERPLVFMVEGSRLFGVDRDFFAALQAGGAGAESELLEAAGQAVRERDFAVGLAAPAAISLNIAQSCNLAGTYCYADEGRFG